MQCAGLAEVSRLHVDRTFNPQIGNVDISGLAPERIARVWPATVLGFIASAVRKRKDFFALSDRAEQAREVDEVLGNHVNDLTLPLHPAAATKHICRENEPALPFEQRRPNDQVRNVRFVFERDEQDPIGRARPLADKHEPRDGHAATITRCAEIARRT